MTFEPFTTPPLYEVTIQHPLGRLGSVTVRSASAVNAPEVGRLAHGDILTCTLDFLDDGVIWATIADFKRVPHYQGGHFALVFPGTFGLKTFGTYKLVDHPQSEEYIIHHKNGIDRKFVLE
jgi:hypothetical protein